MNTKLSPIKEILRKKNATLGNLVAQAHNNLQLQQQLAKHLSPQLYKQINIVKWQQQELVISMPQGSLFTRMRYQLPELENQLRLDPVFNGIKKIRLIPESPQPAEIIPKRKPHPAVGTKHHLQTLRDALGDAKEN
ncbi:MAG TPA: hypothetical protein DCZ03_15330 [Gammaproteobacteria bacterium]|nr:hypothetical protein [Gammaproteobacteria bacterium]